MTQQEWIDLVLQQVRDDERESEEIARSLCGTYGVPATDDAIRLVSLLVSTINGMVDEDRPTTGVIVTQGS